MEVVSLGIEQKKVETLETAANEAKMLFRVLSSYSE